MSVGQPAVQNGCGRWPNVYVLGTQKAATTSLAKVLRGSGFVTSQGSCCSLSGWKHCSEESHFFDLSRQCAIDHECSAYPTLYPQGGQGAFDCTPTQITDPRQPSALKAVMPPPLHSAARFIVILREPASRLLSWYNHKLSESPCPWCTYCAHRYNGVFLQDGSFSPTFSEDVACNMREFSSGNQYQGWYRNKAGGTDRGTPPLDIMRGLLYRDGIEAWSAAFSRSQLLVLNFHALVQAPARFMTLIGNFIGSRLGSFGHTNQARDPRAVTSMCCEDSCQLAQFHRKSNAQLLLLLSEQQRNRGRGRSAAPPEEPHFGSFPPPRCVPCAPPTGAVTTPCDPKSKGDGNTSIPPRQPASPPPALQVISPPPPTPPEPSRAILPTLSVAAPTTTPTIAQPTPALDRAPALPASLQLDGASAAVLPSVNADCPAWCVVWRCDGSAWCLDGAQPRPCRPCPVEVP